MNSWNAYLKKSRIKKNICSEELDSRWVGSTHLFHLIPPYKYLTNVALFLNHYIFQK